MLKFSSMSPELERLNELGYRLPLNDSEIKRMQNLNRSWSTGSAQTTERFRYDTFRFVDDTDSETGCTIHCTMKNVLRLTHLSNLFPCSKLQSFLLQQQTFLEKCETWMEFLVQTEKNLAVEISGNYQSLIEQQKAHEVRAYFKMKEPKTATVS